MPKRRSDMSPTEVSSQPAAKKAKTSTISKLLDLKPEEIAHEELIESFSELQKAYTKLQSDFTSASVKPNAPAEAEDPAKVAEMAGKLADMMESGITKQMQWQYAFFCFNRRQLTDFGRPSCKTGGKR
jgi:hypothetical protein